MVKPTAHIEKRNAPSLQQALQAQRDDPDYVGRKVFSRISEEYYRSRNPGTMPTEKDLSSLTKYERNWVRALVLQEKLMATLSSRTWNFDLSDPSDCPHIDDLIQNQTYMQCCLYIIEMIVLTDFQICFAQAVFNLLYFPSCYCQVTTLSPIDKHDFHMGNVHAKPFIILLAHAMKDNYLPNYNQMVLRLCHELHAHASSIEWSVLSRSSIYDNFDGNYFCFALSLLGARKARQIYRLPTNSRSTGPFEGNISSSFLLRDVEVFAEEMVRTKPTDATGYKFKAWVHEQVPKIRKGNGLRAAADSLECYVQAYERADKQGDDVISAAARIDACYCILVGGAGMVAHPLDAVVRRDFSSKGKENMTKEKIIKGKKVMHILDIKCLRDMNHANMVKKYEMNRFEKGLDPADLEDDSYPLVEWWKIVELWNRAMVSFDRLDRINLGHLAFGECWSWNVIYDALIRWTEVERLNFEDEQYATGPIEYGISGKRDKGFEFCEYCGSQGNPQMKLMQCSRCQSSVYCSRECQKKHWKSHKLSCFPKK